MRRPTRRALLAASPALLVAGCGFSPLHAPQGQSLPPIAIEAPPTEAGFVLRERLLERLPAGGVPAWTLAVDLDLAREGAGITRRSAVTRYVLIGEATYSLLPAGGAEPVLTEAVAARTAWSAPASDAATAFAARSAEIAARERLARTLADRIALRLALHFRAAGGEGA
jgi:LPS-assembly lipoprotein